MADLQAKSGHLQAKAGHLLTGPCTCCGSAACATPCCYSADSTVTITWDLVTYDSTTGMPVDPTTECSHSSGTITLPYNYGTGGGGPSHDGMWADVPLGGPGTLNYWASHDGGNAAGNGWDIHIEYGGAPAAGCDYHVQIGGSPDGITFCTNCSCCGFGTQTLGAVFSTCAYGFIREDGPYLQGTISLTVNNNCCINAGGGGCTHSTGACGDCPP